MTITTKRIPKAGGKNSIEGLEVVMVDGREVGFVTKIRDNRTDRNPFKAFIGIGMAAKMIGAFYTDSQVADMRFADPRDAEGIQHGGKAAAIRLIARYAGA